MVWREGAGEARARQRRGINECEEVPLEQTQKSRVGDRRAETIKCNHLRHGSPPLPLYVVIRRPLLTVLEAEGAWRAMIAASSTAEISAGSVCVAACGVAVLLVLQ